MSPLGSLAAFKANTSPSSALARLADTMEHGFWRPKIECLLSPGAVAQEA